MSRWVEGTQIAHREDLNFEGLSGNEGKQGAKKTRLLIDSQRIVVET